MDDLETVRACFAGIRERPEAAAALAADGSEFSRTELRLRRAIVATPAFARRYDPETFRTRHAGIREGLPTASTLAADRCELARAGLLYRRPGFRAAFAAVQHAEAVGTCVAGIGEGPYASAALSTDGSVFHRTYLRAWRR